MRVRGTLFTTGVIDQGGFSTENDTVALTLVLDIGSAHPGKILAILAIPAILAIF
jgi:hypothetical protein